MRSIRRRLAGLLSAVLILGLGGCRAAESSEPEPGDSDQVAEEAPAADVYGGPEGVGGESVWDSVDGAVLVPAGTEIVVRIDDDLSTADNTAGDGFDGTVARDVVTSTDRARVPNGTPVRGTVTEARASSGPEVPAVLALSVDELQLNGHWIPIDGTTVRADIRTDSRDSNSETAAKVAVGAAAGAIIGQVLGKDTQSTLTGAGVGAVAGTIIAVTTRSGHASVGEGSTLVVRLDAPIPR